MKRIFLFATFLAATSANAQQTDTTELVPVEVKATRAAATAPFAKTNLSKAEIQAQNLGQDLPFVLNQTPSVVINADAGNGVGYTGIRIRGTDATRINVTINGIPFNDPESNGAFFVNLPDLLSSTSSIQVQRGVGTSTNGAAAFGGTISLSTNENNTQPYAEFNNTYGSFHTLKHTVKMGTGLINNRFTADMRLSQISSNGFIDRAKSKLQSYYFSAAYLLEKSTLRFTNFSGKEKTYQAWYGVNEQDRENNRRANYAGTEKSDAPYENETDNYNQDHYQLLYSHQLKPYLSLQTGLFYVRGKGFYEQYKADESYASYGLPDPVYGSSTITNTDLVRQLWLANNFYGDVFSINYQKAGTDITLGGAYTKYNGDHFGYVTWAKNGLADPARKWYDHNADKRDVNFYGKWQQSLYKSLQAFVDLQVRDVKYAIDGFRNNPTINMVNRYSFFNPKAGLTYQRNNITAFASYSIANKEPNRDDFEASAATMPLPERLHDWEVGLEKKERNYSFGCTIYLMQYNNQLVLTGKINDVGAYTRTNIKSSYRAGAELQAASQPASWLKLSGNVTISKNKLKNYTEFIDDYDNGGQKTNFYKETTIALSPSFTAATNVAILPFAGLQLNLAGKYVGVQYLDNTGNAARQLNAFYVQDVKATYSIKKGWLKNATAVFAVNNLLNKKYEPNGYTFSYYYNAELTTENYYFPMAGINYMAALNIRF